MNYRSPFSSEKFIEIYTNPTIITSLTLNNCSIQEIPKSRLTSLDTFSFSTNGLVDFPDLVLFVCNSTQIQRNLLLFFQLQEIGLPMILLLNMTDKLRLMGKKINYEQNISEIKVIEFDTDKARVEG